MSGITDAGFIKPTDQELEDELNEDFKNEFGSKVTLTPETFLGQQLAIIKKRELELWDVLEDIYFSLFASTATGVNLDRAAFPFSRLEAQRAIAILTFTGDDQTVIPIGTIVETVDGIQFQTTEEETIEDSSGGTGTVDVSAISVLSGSENNLPIDSLTVLPIAISGVDSVTNNTAAIGGTDVETDGDFFARIKVEAEIANGSSAKAIQEALIAVSGVVQATVTENNTDIEVDGIPSHSILVVVNATASDEDIAQVIFETKSAGIGTSGSITVNIEHNNTIYPISFSKSTLVNIHVDVNLTVTSSWVSENVDIVKGRVLEYIGGVNPSNIEFPGLEAGGDVLLWKISAALFNLQSRDDLGIIDTYIEASRDDDPSSGEDGNLAIGPSEEAITDFTLIEVNVTVV